MKAERNIAIAGAWFNAFNEHNLEQLLSLYDEQAQHYSPKLKIRQPETTGWIKGKQALRSWWADAFGRIPGLRYDVLTLTANEKRIFMEYRRKAPGEEDMTVGEVLEINDNGLITASRVYHQ